MDSTHSAYPVYIGVWTNWSYGRVLGSTLTLKRQDGALLIAFVAFFVTLVGAHIWKLLCFLLFQLYSDNSPKDALHHQRQAVLRNYSSPIGAMWILLQMLQAWATPAAATARARPLLRILPLLLGTFLAAVALTAASGLSSQITQGNEVLVDGSRCGIVRQDAFANTSDYNTLYSPYRRRQRERAAEYAQRCYESGSTSESCGIFVRSALPLKVKRDAPCPFDKSICRSQDSNVLIESGPFDSLEDLGLNWQAKDRFKLQHRMHCAPLVTDEYRSMYKLDNDTYTRYQYGDQSSPPSDCNCTVAVNKDLLKKRFDGATTGSFFEPFQDYSIISLWAQFSQGEFLPQWSLFWPIPELRAHQGDLSLTFLFPNEVLFIEESKDDWYRATVPVTRGYQGQEENGGDRSLSLYAAEEPAWPMGCVEQFQVCQQDYCTGWGSRNDTVRGMYRHTHMASGFLGLGSFIDLMDHPVNLITALGKESLASRYKAADALQTGAEVNEWHLDAVHWVSTILSMLQFQVAEISGGPDLDNKELEKYITRPNSTEHSQYCKSQKIRTTAYTSFSMFGLLFIIIAGALIIVVSVCIESLAALVHQRLLSKPTAYSRIEWRANHVLHLQRLAYEGVSDQPEWRLGHWDTPVAKQDSALAVLDASLGTGLPRFVTATGKSPILSMTQRELVQGAPLEEKTGFQIHHLEAVQSLAHRPGGGSVLEHDDQRSVVQGDFASSLGEAPVSTSLSIKGASTDEAGRT